MPSLVSHVGARVDLEIVKGSEFTKAHTLKDATGATITTISSARVVFKTGRISDPGSAVSGVTVTPSVAENTTITWSLTDDQTNVAGFVAGDDYCWFLEVTYADGGIQEIFRGDVAIFEEGA